MPLNLQSLNTGKYIKGDGNAPGVQLHRVAPIHPLLSHIVKMALSDVVKKCMETAIVHAWCHTMISDGCCENDSLHDRHVKVEVSLGIGWLASVEDGCGHGGHVHWL